MPVKKKKKIETADIILIKFSIRVKRIDNEKKN